MCKNDILIYVKQVCNEINKRLSSQLLFFTFYKLIKKLTITKGDSGATKHYLISDDSKTLLNNKVYNQQGVTNSNSTQLKLAHQRLLPLSNLLTSG